MQEVVDTKKSTQHDSKTGLLYSTLLLGVLSELHHSVDVCYLNVLGVMLFVKLTIEITLTVKANEICVKNVKR
jgi:hypothetical protein